MTIGTFPSHGEQFQSGFKVDVSCKSSNVINLIQVGVVKGKWKNRTGLRQEALFDDNIMQRKTYNSSVVL